MNQKAPSKKSYRSLPHALIILLLLASFFYKLPYYYTVPGEAKELAPFVDVQGGFKDEKGSFMLTTVQMGKANIYDYGLSLFSDNRALIPERQLRPKYESNQEFFHRQQMLMSNSQEQAKIVAYKAANKKLDYEYHGILVTSIVKEMPAADILQAGDHILAVDGERVLTVLELNEQLANKQEGQNVQLTIKRNEEKMVVAVPMAKFPIRYERTGDQVGLGLNYPITARNIHFEPSITIETTDIGGPSAGLMFSLEIYNQLVEEDITKGYRIAGTGQINEEGKVLRIGGIKQKIIAADKAKADIFFAPNEEGRSGSNYEEAIEKAQEINTNMMIVPVDTFAEALTYLYSLEDKIDAGEAGTKAY